MTRDKLLQRLSRGWRCEEPRATPGTYRMHALLSPPDGVDERVDRVPRSLLSAMTRSGLLRRRTTPGKSTWYATSAGLDIGRTA